MEVVQLTEFLYADNPPARSVALDAKAEGMRATYKCFSAAAPASREADVRWTRKRDEPKTRPIPSFVKQLSGAAAAKKEFLALMNKLNNKNKASILNQVRSAMKVDYIDTYVDVIWDMCLDSPSYQAVYLDVIDLVGRLGPAQLKAAVQKKVDDYIDTGSYIPNTPMSNAIADEAEYDEFCLANKLKKRANAFITLAILLESKEVLTCLQVIAERLVHVSETYLERMEYDIADPLLDQLLTVYKHSLVMQIRGFTDIITSFVQRWVSVSEKMRPSTKFKFYSFVEALERNSRNVNRWTSKTRLLAGLR